MSWLNLNTVYALVSSPCMVRAQPRAFSIIAGCLPYPYRLIIQLLSLSGFCVPNQSSDCITVSTSLLFTSISCFDSAILCKRCEGNYPPLISLIHSIELRNATTCKACSVEGTFMAFIFVCPGCVKQCTELMLCVVCVCVLVCLLVCACQFFLWSEVRLGLASYFASPSKVLAVLAEEFWKLKPHTFLVPKCFWCQMFAMPQSQQQFSKIITLNLNVSFSPLSPILYAEHWTGFWKGTDLFTESSHERSALQPRQN